MKELQLANNLFINKGRYRECFHHPDNQNWVVKIQRLEAFDFSKEDSPHMRELRFYERLSDNTHFPKLIGAQQTNRGLGLIFEKIQNHDGSPAVKLLEFISKNASFSTDLYEQVIAIIDQLTHDELLSCSANHENLLVIQNQHGRKVMSCDSKEITNKQFHNSLYFFKKKKVKRRYERLKKFYTKLYQASSAVIDTTRKSGL